MKYRVLGRTGVKVHPICLGTMNFGGRSSAEESHGILNAYLDAGGNFIDTANVYNDGKSEAIIGDWLEASGKRDQIVLSTKVHGRRSDHINDAGNHRWHIVREVEQSLKRLKTDRIDLYHIHRPDPDTPIDQTLRAPAPVRTLWLPWNGGRPLKVVSVCLPFALVKLPSGRHRPLDVRRYRLARLSKRYGREAFRRLAEDNARERKRSK